MFVLAVLVVLDGCTRAKHTYDMKWEVASAASCAGEPEVTLRFLKAPKYYVSFCSSKLADALKTGGKPIVPMVIRGGKGSFSVCAVATVTNDAPNTECTFGGLTSSGYDCNAARDGECGGPNANKPTPWD